MTSGRPPVAVLAALRLEAETLSRRLSPTGEGELEGEPVVLMITGVGKVAAARATQLVCDRYAPRCVLSIGLAGGVDSDSPRGRLIVASGAVQHDYDARPIARARGELPDLGMSAFPADPDVEAALTRATELTLGRPGLVASGLVLTGDQIITSREVRDRTRAEFPGGVCFDMETAAVAQVAYLNRVPWGAVRITSDAADESFEMNEVLAFGSYTAADLFDRIIRAFLGGG